MLNKFFVPYAEYTHRTKLSEAEFRAALKQNCGASFANYKSFFLSAWQNLDEVPFSIRKCKSEIVLIPGCRGRNSARGEVHLTFEKDQYSADTILHIIIRPADFRWFCVLWLGFLLCWTIGVLCARKWMMLIAPPFMFGGFVLVLSLCRSMGEQEIPLIQHSFEALLRKLEMK